MMADYELYSWGQGCFGALGTGLRGDIVTPRRIRCHDHQIVKFSCGDRHSAFITQQGQLLMTGSNESGQCGMSGFVELLTPTTVTKKNVIVKSVKCGYSHTLILQNDGTLHSFGCNQFGQLGLGREVCGGPQIKSINLKDVVKIRVSNFSAALTKDSELWVWGCTVLGEYYTPTKVSVPSTSVQLKQVSLGASFGCILDQNGSIFTWGKNNSGELALGDDQPRNQICRVKALKNKQIRKIACGSNFLICLGKDSQPKGILKKRLTEENINNLNIRIDDETPFKREHKSPFDREQKKFSGASLFVSTPSTHIMDKSVFMEAVYGQNQELLNQNKSIQKENELLIAENKELKHISQVRQDEFLQTRGLIHNWENKLNDLEDIISQKDDQIDQMTVTNSKLVDRINQILQDKKAADTLILELERKLVSLDQEKIELNQLIYNSDQELQIIQDKYENCLTRLEQKNHQIDKQKQLIDQLNNSNEEMRKRQQIIRDLQDQNYSLNVKNTEQEKLIKRLNDQLSLLEEKNNQFVHMVEKQINQTAEEFKLNVLHRVKLENAQENYLMSKYLDKKVASQTLDELLEKQKQVIGNSANKLREQLNAHKEYIIELESSGRQRLMSDS